MVRFLLGFRIGRCQEVLDKVAEEVESQGPVNSCFLVVCVLCVASVLSCSEPVAHLTQDGNTRSRLGKH